MIGALFQDRNEALKRFCKREPITLRPFDLNQSSQRIDTFKTGIGFRPKSDFHIKISVRVPIGGRM